MRSVLFAIAAAVALGASAASGQPADLRGLSGTIKIDGSSTVFPISEAIAEEFRGVAPRVKVTVGQSGTGGGFKRFAVGETEISDASRPIKKEEAAAAAQNRIEYIELPIAYDGLTIVVHPKNTWADHLTLGELRKIFTEEGRARTWKEVRPSWPDRPIKIYSPGTDSGTFDYFKEVVAGKDGAIRSDMNVSEDDNVLVRGVAGDEGAIGFFGVAYYEENRGKLRAVPVDGGQGPVAPTAESIESGAYAPFSRPLLIYVNRKSAGRPELKAFVEFYLQNAPALAAEVGYVPLPSEIYGRALANFRSGKTGSQYLTEDGEHRSGPVADIYR